MGDAAFALAALPRVQAPILKSALLMIAAWLGPKKAPRELIAALRTEGVVE